MSIETCNERSTWKTTIAFTDEDGEAVAPSSAQYQIDDICSGSALRESTSITELDTEVDVIWEPGDTAILDEVNAYELRRMTVDWQYGSPSISYGHQEYLLQIKNLRGVTTPSPA